MARRLLFGLTISAAFLFALFYSLDFAAVLEGLLSMQPAWLVPALGLYFVGVWLRSLRWHYLLQPICLIPTAALFQTLVIGFTVNNLMPVRLGEIARAILLARSWQVPMSATLGTILVERFFDGLALSSFLAVGLLLLPAAATAAGWLVTLAQLASLAFIAAIAVAATVVARPEAFLRLGKRVLSAAPRRMREKAARLLEEFVGGMRSLREKRLVLRLVGLSVVAWLFEAGMYYAIMLGFPFEAGPVAALLGAAAANLGTMIPSSPGYIGTFDLPLSAVLSGAFGVAASLATGYTLVVHAALIVPVVILGLLFLARNELTLRQLSRVGGIDPLPARPAPTRGEELPSRGEDHLLRLHAPAPRRRD